MRIADVLACSLDLSAVKLHQAIGVPRAVRTAREADGAVARRWIAVIPNSSRSCLRAFEPQPNSCQCLCDLQPFAAVEGPATPPVAALGQPLGVELTGLLAASLTTCPASKNLQGSASRGLIVTVGYREMRDRE